MGFNTVTRAHVHPERCAPCSPHSLTPGTVEDSLAFSRDAMTRLVVLLSSAGVVATPLLLLQPQSGDALLGHHVQDVGAGIE